MATPIEFLKRCRAILERRAFFTFTVFYDANIEMAQVRAGDRNIDEDDALSAEIYEITNRIQAESIQSLLRIVAHLLNNTQQPQEMPGFDSSHPEALFDFFAAVWGTEGMKQLLDITIAHLQDPSLSLPDRIYLPSPY